MNLVEFLIVQHLDNELVHHGAEVGVLRDVRRAGLG